MTRPLAALLVALALSGCAHGPAPKVAAVPRASHHFPWRSLDLSIAGNGAPMIRADGTLDPARCDSAARYDIVFADADPLLARQDIAAAIVKRNPGILLIAYLAGGTWDNPHPGLGDTTTSLWRLRYRLVRDAGALLYATDSTLWDPYDNVDRSNHRAMLALADLDARAAAVPGVAGIFLDTFCADVSWMQTPTRRIDYRHAGFLCFEDWQRAYAQGQRLYAERLRERVGAKLLIGNCGPSGPRDVLNGWTRENFPYQNGGTWAANMVGTAADPGYLYDADTYRRPTISGLSNPVSGDSATDARVLEFGMASAALGEGTYALIGSRHRASAFPWPALYDLDLGSPLSRAFQTGPALWRREFTRGYVEVNVAGQRGRIVQR